MARTIQSPGVQLTETDISLNSTLQSGTNILINGYTDVGPTQELLYITSIEEYVQIYGDPKTAAERYSYHTALQALNTPANVVFNRLPYGEGTAGAGDPKYSALLYPSISCDLTTPETITISDAILTDANGDYVYNSTLDQWINATTSWTISFGDTANGNMWGISTDLDVLTYVNFTDDTTPPTDGWYEITSVLLAYTVATDGIAVTGLTDALGNGTYDYVPLDSNWVHDTNTDWVIDKSEVDGVDSWVISDTGVTIVFNTMDAETDTPPTTLWLDPTDTGVVVATEGTSALQVAMTDADSYFIAKPTQVELTQAEYEDWLSGNIDWVDDATGTAVTEGNAALIVINKLQTSVNEDFEGYYVGICDNTQASTTVSGADFVFNAISKVTTNKDSIDTWQDVSENRLNFNLVDDPDSDIAKNGSNSISEVLEGIPTWEFGEDTYNDSIVLGLYKLRKSGYSTNDSALDFVGYESYAGAFGKNRVYTEPNGFQQVTFDIAKQVKDSSLYMDVLVNPYMANQTWLGDDGTPNKVVRMVNDASIEAYGLDDLTVPVPTDDASDALYPVGLFSDSTTEAKVIGTGTSAKLNLGLSLADNYETLPLDIVVDAGLAEINATMAVYNMTGDASPITEYSDDLKERGVYTEYTGGTASTGTLADPTEGSSSAVQLGWQNIFNLFENFCSQTRQDCYVIIDPVRDIFVQGFDRKTLANKSKNFSQHIYTPMKNLVSKGNSNYACTYANWIKVFDDTLGDNCWVPYSGFQAAIEANKDSNLYPWYAGAGLNNGIVSGALDISINPTQKQRDLLYKNNINPVVFFPGDGIISWGQKTLQKKPSAFDRINVRRLFLTLEKATRATAKYFVFEPNTVFTRTRVINTLTPLFETAKNNQGVYDYKIVCDERNNTPTVIDANELVVDIYIKPVRTAEFILINFYATRTDQNFDELI